jgi:glycerol-3-phosphate dehydrogenase
LRERVWSGEPSGSGTLDRSLTIMRRDIPRLAETPFDLLVVGAGIFGACAAWDASLRGLSVAVVDQGDFGAATSANSLRIVHGGLRYLARGHFGRMRESIRERSALLRIAPGLVEPLEVLVPTYGHGAQGRAAYAGALALNELISSGRNRGLDTSSRIPPGRLVSNDECLASYPWFPKEGLTGGAVWYDAQLRHPERLTLSFLQSAARRGAQAANYLRVDSLLTSSGAVHGARVTERLTGSQFEIRSRAVLVAAGPWTEGIVNTAVSAPTSPETPLPLSTHALAMNVVLDRRLAEVAVGVRARSGSQEDPVCGGRRFLFCAPQGGRTVLGTWYTASSVGDESTRLHGAKALVKEFNDACPELDLTKRNVVDCQWGWLPLKNGNERGRPDALAERTRITDHRAAHGVRYLISVEGVKFTTARRVVEQAIDRVFVSLGRAIPPCRTAEQQLDQAMMPPEVTQTLTEEEIFRAVRQEMAVKLSDLVFRRTRLGAAPKLQRRAVEAAARTFGVESGWDERRVVEEVDAVMREVGAPRTALETVA